MGILYNLLQKRYTEEDIASWDDNDKIEVAMHFIGPGDRETYSALISEIYGVDSAVMTQVSKMPISQTESALNDQ